VLRPDSRSISSSSKAFTLVCVEVIFGCCDLWWVGDLLGRRAAMFGVGQRFRESPLRKNRNCAVPFFPRSSPVSAMGRHARHCQCDYSGDHVELTTPIPLRPLTKSIADLGSQLKIHNARVLGTDRQLAILQSEYVCGSPSHQGMVLAPPAA